MSELIRYDVCDRVATVTLHRPDKRNALNHRLVAEPKGALAEAAVRVVVLTGAGKVFSAGADLAALEALQAATPMLNAAENHSVATWAGAVPITTGYCWRTQDRLQNGPGKHDLESPRNVNSSLWGVRQQYPTVFGTLLRPIIGVFSLYSANS